MIIVNFSIAFTFSRSTRSEIATHDTNTDK